jgi:hypothetical protein
MPRSVRVAFHGAVGLVIGAFVGVVGFALAVLALDAVFALLSFITGLPLPEIVIGNPSTIDAGEWVLPTGVLRVTGLLGAIVGVIWRLTGPNVAVKEDAP